MIDCACGKCVWCTAIRMGRPSRPKKQRTAPTRCTCASRRGGIGKCDFCWNQIFERNHGEAAREYYETPEGRHLGSSLENAAGTNGLDLRGLAGISRPAR